MAVVCEQTYRGRVDTYEIDRTPIDPGMTDRQLLDRKMDSAIEKGWTVLARNNRTGTVQQTTVERGLKTRVFRIV